MKKIIVTLATMLACFGAFAQSATGTQNTSQTQSAASQASNAGNQQGVTLNIAAPVAAATRAIDASIGDQTVHYDYGTQVIKNTPSMGAANLTTSNDTCMGSSSGALGVPGVGLALGTTWVDENCSMLKQARELYNMGMKGAAMARLCEDSKVKKSLELTGFTCPQSMAEDERNRVYNIKSRQVAVIPVATKIAGAEDPYIAMSGRKLGQSN